MGYELNIKREDKSKKITKDEWANYINSNSDFEPIEERSASTKEGITLTISTPSAGLWKTEKHEVPFTFYESHGEITVKNPDNWIIEKMISMAQELNAVVEGEEGEIYDENYLKNQLVNPSDTGKLIGYKKWWQFWKE